MPDDFFNKQDSKMDDITPTPVKVGEKEYSQEELTKLVGLGETAQEYETKWNRPIKDFYPDYTQKSQKLADFERQQVEQAKLLEEQKQRELDEKAKKGQDLSPEEARQMARKQAQDLGIVTDDQLDGEVNRRVANALAAKELIEDVKSVLGEAKEKGQPQATPEDLLKYMDENGVKSPEKAYKLMYEGEIDKWKEEQLKKVRPSGFITQDNPTAGAKAPPPPQPVTRENLGQAIRDSLMRSQGV